VGMYPCDTVKTRMQIAATTTNPAGFYQTARSIFAERGIYGFCRGATVIGTGCIPAHIGLFTMYEIGKSQVLADKMKSDSVSLALRGMLCGAAAAVIHDAILTPYDVVKQRLQLGMYHSPWHCFRAMLREEGPVSFYRSLPVTLLSNVPNVAVLAAINESLKSAWDLKARKGSHGWYFLVGGIAGGIAAGVTCPLDVIKTRLQTARGTNGEGMVRGAIDTGRQIWRSQGIAGLYLGWQPRVLAAAPSAALCWGTYESVQALLAVMLGDLSQNVATGPMQAVNAVGAGCQNAPNGQMQVMNAGCHNSACAEADEDPLEWERWDPSKIPFWKHVLAGSSAGVMEHVAMYPVDTVKTHMQAVSAEGAAPLTVRGTVMQIVQNGGIMALFRGSLAIGGGCIPAHVGLFGTYEITKSLLLKPGDEKEHAPLAAAACGALSTLVHDSLIVPMDVVKQRMQLGCYENTWHCIQSVIKCEGVIALYRSLPSTVVMECPFFGILVASNESLKLAFKLEGAGRVEQPSIGWHFLTSGLSGIAASALTQPLDVVKTRLQTQEIVRDMAKKQEAGLETCTPGVHYTGLRQTVSRIFTEEGVRGFYRGTVPRMMFAAPSAALCWGTYEAVKLFLLQW